MTADRPLRWAAPAVVAAAVLAFYGPFLGRSFTSEDFLLIRFFGEHPPWADWRALFAEPWLGIAGIRFYRPVSTLLYGLEIAAFGAAPFGYNLVHVLLHGANALLFWGIARRLLAPWAAFAAALLFALHPLHPNAVIFGASFATLFAGTFLLGAFLAYRRFRETGSRPAWAAAFALFALGLGSYEAAAVFPAWLLAHDLLFPGEPSPRPRRFRRLLPSLPFFALLGGYLLLRRAIFGVFVGGYEQTGERLLAPRLGALARDLATSLHRTLLPEYQAWPGPAALAASLAFLILGPLLFFVAFRRFFRRSGPAREPARAWLLGGVWAVTSFAPFGFLPPVPGTGRYAYFAAAGLALALAGLAAGVAGAAPRLRWAAAVALAVLGVYWGVLLAGMLGVYREAAETAAAVRAELLRVGEGAAGPVFLTRYPYFIENEAGVPLAQVLHYGVWDMVHPPFAEAGVEARPLPPLAGIELAPVALGGGRVFAWDREAGEARAVSPPVGGRAELEVVEAGPEHLLVRVPPGPHARFRLLVAARINGAVFDLGTGERKGDLLRVELPRELLWTNERLYGGEVYGWVEARDGQGRVTGFTRMRALPR
jgi:protein O-mannosyl-transferase